MAQLKNIFKKVILLIVAISILITFCAMPSSYAKLDLEDGEFYYAGTQKGQYTVSEGIFDWLLSKIGDIADWILGIITMGFRMVFVGWTALLEKMLTWALESTAGVAVNGDVVESNTDLTSITDSSSNVTIEAIVYNHVPALDANPFHLTRSEDEAAYSGTGHILTCTNKNCSGEKNHKVTECQDGENCSCDDKCEGCQTYKNALANIRNNTGDKPIIYQIKESVAFWYYVIRNLAIAAMLVVLIAVGIKMATSTLAQDKAVYKRMLVDWVVGMIILFGVHYIMVFTFYLNEEMVKVIEETSTSVYQVQMKQLAEKDSQDGVEYNNEELELKIYEAIRTRAYDAKLIDGLTGTIMYMTLVYFAFRYTIVYLKRFFTIIVLTIMSPGIGVGYALQKVLTGKQQALKTWLSEYVLNVIIQLVHALIYSIFISQALVLSLESVSGIIVALILMNYTVKADKLFRKIFKISTGGGLVDDTNDSAEKFKETLTGAVVGGQAAVKTLTNTPYTSALKGIGKAAVAVPGLAIGGARKGINSLRSNKESTKTTEDTEGEDTLGGAGGNTGGGSSGGDSGQADSRHSGGNNGTIDRSSTGLPRRSDNDLLGIGKKTLTGNLEKAKQAVLEAKTPEERDKAMAKYLTALDEYNRYEKLTTPSTAKVAAAHLERLVDIDNTFVFNEFTGGKGKGVGGNIKALFKFAKDNAKPLYHGIYGNKYRDPVTGKMINDGSGYYNQLRPTNLLGLTKEDKDLLKKQMGLVTGTFAGMASMFLGMSTLVANPKVGMGLLASGAALTNRGLGRSRKVGTYKGKYAFSRFGIPTIQNMERIALKKAQLEHDDLMIQSVKERHAGFYRKMKAGTITAATLGTIATGGATIVPATLMGTAAVTSRFMQKTNIGQGLEDLNDHWMKQQKKQEKEFKVETLKVLNVETQARMALMLDEENQKLDSEESKYVKQIYESLGYEYDPKTGNLTLLRKNMSEEDKKQEEFENQLDAKLKNNTIDEAVIESKINPESHLSDSEVGFIDQEIDNILVAMSSGKTLDMNSEAALDMAMDQLTARLTKAGIITDKQKADVVFISGKEGLKRALKEKAQLANTKIEIANKALESINGADAEFIKEAIRELIEGKEGVDFTQITPEEILAKVDASRAKVARKKEREKADQKGKKSKKSKTTEAENVITTPLTSEEKRSYGEKIVAYLANLEMAKKATHNSNYSKKKEARKQVKSSLKRRKKKLKQILEMAFNMGEEDQTDDLMDQIRHSSRAGGFIKDMNGHSIQVLPEESDKMLEMLFLRKELQEINNVAMEEVDYKKGSYAFKKAVKAKSEATIEYYSDNLEIQRYAQANPEIYADPNYQNRRDYYTGDQITERDLIAEKERTLADKKKTMQRRERELSMSGPIVDLNEAKKRLLNN